MQRRQLTQSLLTAIGVERLHSTNVLAHSQGMSSIVGAWRILAQGAPELHHVLTFSRDGIVTAFQADAGDPIESVSSGAGMYEYTGQATVKGAFEEDRYSRETHTYVGYVRVEFSVEVLGDAFTGTAHTQVFDASGSLLADGTPTLSARRIVLER